MANNPRHMDNLKNGVKFGQHRKCIKEGCNATARSNSRFCRHHSTMKRNKAQLTEEKARRRGVYDHRRILQQELIDIEKLIDKEITINSHIYDDALLDRAFSYYSGQYDRQNLSFQEYRAKLRYLDTLQKPHIRNKVKHD